MIEQSIWDAPPLSPEDERLIGAYMQIGTPVDQLAYSDDFERLFSMLALPDTQASRHAAFRRLLTLRKMARLPSAVGAR